MICLIFLICYFIAILFHSYCHISIEIDQNDGYHFFDYYDILSKDVFHQTFTLTYFSFTSMTTVGFGDYVPRSEYERIFIAFMLPFGVATFSIIMGIFINILNEFKQINSPDFDDDENLLRFISAFRRYNNDKDLDERISQNIENFFSYKWSWDRNNCLKSKEDIKLY